MRIIVPVKRFSAAKERLAECLPPTTRAALARAMAEDMIEKLAVLRGVEEIMIVSDDNSLEIWKSRFAFDLFRPAESGLNGVLDEALSWQAARGAARVLLLHADLPAARVSDLQQLVDAKDEIIIVPDRHMLGTNAMALSCPPPFATAFGGASLDRHLRRARQAGVSPRVCTLPSLGADLDTEADILTILTLGGDGRAMTMLREIADHFRRDRDRLI